jgi:hypothetical protein
MVKKEEMKIKVSIFDKRLFGSYLAVLSVISLLTSFGLIAFQLPDDFSTRVVAGIIIFALLVIVFLAMWVHANLEKSASLNFNNSTVEIKVGDIFNESGLKAIPFNEFFDTQVDERIIASTTLNGIFLKKLQSKIGEIECSIENVNKTPIEFVSDRLNGKKKRYELGSVCQFEDYLMVAFSKFDKDNRAHLRMRDYIESLINFWNEVDIIYAGRSVSIPLFGSGITRFHDYSSISEQELLELIIWSFKISRVKFTYPSKVSVVIHESIVDKINFYKLKGC